MAVVHSVGAGCSGYHCRCALILFLALLLLLVMTTVRASDAVVPPEDAVVPPEDASAWAATHTCRDVFMECQAGVANEACCAAINKKIRDHQGWGHPCVCRQLRGQCRLAARCSTAFCPNCRPCRINTCPAEADEVEGPIV